MKKNNRKIYWTILIVWGILACISTISYALTSGEDAKTVDSPFWSIAYWSAFCMIAIAIIFMLCFAVTAIGKGLKEAPKKQIPILGSIALLVIVFAVCWGVSSGTDIPRIAFEKVGTDYGSSKIIGGALYMVYVLLAGVVLSLVGSEILKRK